MALVFRSARYAISTCFRTFRSAMERAGQRSGGIAIVERHAPLIQSPAIQSDINLGAFVSHNAIAKWRQAAAFRRTPPSCANTYGASYKEVKSMSAVQGGRPR